MRKKLTNKYNRIITLSLVLSGFSLVGTAVAEDSNGYRQADPNNPGDALAIQAYQETGATVQYHVDMGEGTKVFTNQAEADAYGQAREQAFIQSETQKAIVGGYGITINGTTYGGQNTTQSLNGTQSQDTSGTALLPSPIEPGNLTEAGIPDGYVLVNGALVKGVDNQKPSTQEKTEGPKEEWPAERMEKARQNIAEGLAKYKEQIQAEGRQVSDDEARLAAARLAVQNRVYVNPNLKPTAEENEKDAIKLTQEWKRDNTYMMSDGNTMSFGPGGVAGWIQNERESREKFIRETKASAEGISKGVTPGLTPQEQAAEDGARSATLKNQAGFEKSMREDSEKKIAQILKDTGVADPGLSNSAAPNPTSQKPFRPLVSYEAVKSKP